MYSIFVLSISTKSPHPPKSNHFQNFEEIGVDGWTHLSTLASWSLLWTWHCQLQLVRYTIRRRGLGPRAPVGLLVDDPKIAPNIEGWHIPMFDRKYIFKLDQFPIAILVCRSVCAKKSWDFWLLNWQLTVWVFLVFTLMFWGFPTGWNCSICSILKKMEFAMLHSDTLFVPWHRRHPHPDLGGGFKYVLCSSLFGEDSHVD